MFHENKCPELLKRIKRPLILIGLASLGYFAFNAIQIYRFSLEYNEDESDVAIVLGAGTNNGIISPVFEERINHGIYLYKNDIVQKVVFTGGIGEGQSKSDSGLAKEYAIRKGVPSTDILIEESSRYTIENLAESKRILDSMNLKTVLLVSDPLHMKRSIGMAHKMGMNCKSSPTNTTKYKSTIPKLKSLLYETFFYTGGQLVGKN